MENMLKHLKKLKYYWFFKILPGWKLRINSFNVFSLTRLVFYILKIFVWLGVVAIITTTLFWLTETFLLPIDFSAKGFKFLISTGNPYKEIITISFTIIGLYLIIIQIRQGNFSNKISLKEKWVSSLNDNIKKKLKNSSRESENEETGRRSEITYINPEIVRYIGLRADEIFDFLFDYNMRISNKYILHKFYVKFIGAKIVDFENAANENINRNFIYPTDETFPPSLRHFRQINDFIIIPAEGYSEIYNHFDRMYLETFKIIENTVGN